MSNSVGLVSCHLEYLETDVLKAVCDALPFEVIGCTTLGNAVNGESGMMMLTVTVFTADTVEFAVAETEPLNSESMDKIISESYIAAKSKLSTDPKMIIAFAPMLQTLTGEAQMERLNKASGGIPIFGTVANEHTPPFTNAFTIHNGEPKKDNMCIVLIGGDFDPHFYVTAISEKNVQRQKGLITDSEGCILRTVNDIPTYDYIMNLGFEKTDDGSIQGIAVIPLMVDYNDGTNLVARGVYALTEEHKSAICGGGIPKNGTVAIGTIDFEDVLSTTKSTMESAVETARNGMLIFPCFSRNLILGADVFAEMDAIAERAGDIPYHLCYSGGEIAPLYDNEGIPQNRFHNFSITICTF
jgi:hypothetical protein